MKYFALILIVITYSCNSNNSKKRSNNTRTIWATNERAQYYDSIIDDDTKKAIEDFEKKNEGNLPETESFSGVVEKR